MGARSELEAGLSHRGVSSPPIPTTKTPIGTKSSDEEHSSAERAETVDIGKANSVPNVGGDEAASKISKKKAERAKKQRLVSYSSQESQDSDGVGSRKTSRKRTAVTKLGGVMIDSIFKEAKQGGRREGTGHKLRG